MSFPNTNNWVLNGSGSLPNTEISYDSSTRIDHKRDHQQFMDSAEQELLFNKKQVVESVKETSGATILDNWLWRDSSDPQSGCHQTGDRLFSPKPTRGLNIFNKNGSITVSDLVNMEKKGYENQFGNDSSICLTMSNPVEDPLCLNNGLRRGKISHFGGISENCLPEFVGTTFYPGEKNKLMGSNFHSTRATMFPEPMYNTTDADTISVGPEFSKIDKDFISVGQASSKRDINFMPPNRYYNAVHDSMLSLGQAFNKGNYNINAIGKQTEKGKGNFMSMGPTYYNGHENIYTVDPFYNKATEKFITAPSTYNNGDIDTAVSLGAVYNKHNSNDLSMAGQYEKGQPTTIFFGGFQDNNDEETDPSGRIVSSYDIMLNQSSDASGQKDSVEQGSANVISETISKTDGAKKTKEPKTKNGSSNNFPTNVKSLLSTGILDGVPVKYVSWSREKNLRGVIKGAGYLCSCEDCKLNKVVNAYEFERHAGCKTKHPNNHIYFENGKTIYAVVQELKSTPQEVLFEVIANVTGSPVNQKNFQTWKASFKAATRELQRIYGQDEVIVQS